MQLELAILWYYHKDLHLHILISAPVCWTDFVTLLTDADQDS